MYRGKVTQPDPSVQSRDWEGGADVGGRCLAMGRTCLERRSYTGACGGRAKSRRCSATTWARCPAAWDTIASLPRSFTCEPIPSLDRGFVSRGIESGGGAGRGERRGARLQKNRRRRVNGRAVALQLARVEQLAREGANVFAERNVRVGEVARLCALAAEGALGGGEEDKDKDRKIRLHCALVVFVASVVKRSKSPKGGISH